MRYTKLQASGFSAHTRNTQFHHHHFRLKGYFSRHCDTTQFTLTQSSQCLLLRWHVAGISNITFYVDVGRVPGDYPVLVRYCTTRHYPDPAGYYFKIWLDPDLGICLNFCDSQLYLTQSNARWAFVLHLSDARHHGVTRDR